MHSFAWLETPPILSFQLYPGLLNSCFTSVSSLIPSLTLSAPTFLTLPFALASTLSSPDCKLPPLTQLGVVMRRSSPISFPSAICTPRSSIPYYRHVFFAPRNVLPEIYYAHASRASLSCASWRVRSRGAESRSIMQA